MIPQCPEYLTSGESNYRDEPWTCDYYYNTAIFVGLIFTFIIVVAIPLSIILYAVLHCSKTDTATRK